MNADLADSGRSHSWSRVCMTATLGASYLRFRLRIVVKSLALKEKALSLMKSGGSCDITLCDDFQIRFIIAISDQMLSRHTRIEGN